MFSTKSFLLWNQVVRHDLLQSRGTSQRPILSTSLLGTQWCNIEVERLFVFDKVDSWSSIDLPTNDRRSIIRFHVNSESGWALSLVRNANQIIWCRLVRPKVETRTIRVPNIPNSWEHVCRRRKNERIGTFSFLNPSCSMFYYIYYVYKLLQFREISFS